MRHSIEIPDESAYEQLKLLSCTYPTVISLAKLPCSQLIPLMNKAHEAGFLAIPKLPARRVIDEAEVGSILIEMNRLSLTEILLVGGNDASSTLFQDSLGLAIHCINRHDSPLRTLYFAAHPEGTVEAAPEDLIQIMKQKELMCRQAGLNVTFITQLCVSTDAFAMWIKQVRAANITAPFQIGISTRCSTSALERRLQFCFDVRKARLTDSYRALSLLDHEFVPKIFVEELKSRIDFEQMNICGYHWYCFDTLKNVIEDIDSVGDIDIRKRA